MQTVSYNPLISTFQLSSAASLNLARSQNGVLVNGSIHFSDALYHTSYHLILLVTSVEDNATMSLIVYFENRVSYFEQNPKEVDPVKLNFDMTKLSVSIAL